MSALIEVASTIESINEQIDKLRGERSTLTSRLEVLAHRWDDLYPQKYEKGRPRFADRLSCSRCYFVYVGVHGDEVVFSTDCSYCGSNAGAGVQIKTTWFEHQLAVQA